MSPALTSKTRPASKPARTSGSATRISPRRSPPQPSSTSAPTSSCAGRSVSKNSASAYVSDPADPVPYRHRPIQPTYAADSQWRNWMTEDQRFVTTRKDVAIWTMGKLDHDLTITGEVIADLFATTTGTDMDMVVKLIDQYPEDDSDPAMRGYQLMTNEEIFRGRYLKAFDKPARTSGKRAT